MVGGGCMYSRRKQCGCPEGLAFCLSTRESAETVSGFLAADQIASFTRSWLRAHPVFPPSLDCTCSVPHPMSCSPLVGFTPFLGFGMGKRMVKFKHAFWRSLLGDFGLIFGGCFVFLWRCRSVKEV